MDSKIIIREAKISDYKDLKEIIRTSLGYNSSDEIIKNKLKIIFLMIDLQYK